VHELKSRVSGVVFEPGEPGFAEELAGFNTAVVHTPQLVVGVASTADVVAAVTYAAANGLAVRMQATGHGAEVPITDGLVITTKRLDALSVDPAARTATIGAGVPWSAVVAEAAAHDLAPITGSAATVGAVGYILGGGLGPLARSHGFSSDYLLGATVVTAAGEVVDASPEGDADLFWAIRGGKGGFGVVTEARVRLVAIPELYAGSLTFDGAHAEAVLRGWIDWARTPSGDVTTSLLLIRFPDIEPIPAPIRGRFLATIRLAYPGPATEGEQLAAPLRALAPVERDDLGAMALGDVAAIHADPTEPGPGWGWGTLLEQLDDDFATVLTGQFNPTAPIPFLAIELRQLGQATREDVPEGSAVGGRDGAFAIHVIGAPDPALFAEVLPGAAAGFRAAIAPWIAPKTTVHYAGSFGDETEFRSAWPDATFERLVATRRRVDPDGVFAYGPR
jgi:FAD/FMN-containing dehydrogenase